MSDSANDDETPEADEGDRSETTPNVTIPPGLRRAGWWAMVIGGIADAMTVIDGLPEPLIAVALLWLLMKVPSR